jgi:hypothetical protein
MPAVWHWGAILAIPRPTTTRHDDKNVTVNPLLRRIRWETTTTGIGTTIKTGRYYSDPVGLVSELNTYIYAEVNPLTRIDPLGLFTDGINAGGEFRGHSDFTGNDIFDYTIEDYGLSSPYLQTWRHFRDLRDVENDLKTDLAVCNKYGFQRRMHQGQDYFAL